MCCRNIGLQPLVTRETVTLRLTNSSLELTLFCKGQAFFGEAEEVPKYLVGPPPLFFALRIGVFSGNVVKIMRMFRATYVTQKTSK